MRTVGHSAGVHPQGGGPPGASQDAIWRPSVSPCVTSDVVESVEVAVEFRRAHRLSGHQSGPPGINLGLRRRVTLYIVSLPAGEIDADWHPPVPGGLGASSSGISGLVGDRVRVMRDSAGNVIRICSMEKIEPRGRPHRASPSWWPHPDPEPTEYQDAPRLNNIISALSIEGGVTQLVLNPDSFRVRGHRGAQPLGPDLRPSLLRPPGYPIAKVDAMVAPANTLLTRIPNAATA